MIKPAIAKLVQHKSLSFDEAKDVFDEIFEEKTTPAQIAAFLTALKIKGENEAEIYAAASVVRRRAKKINIRDEFVGIENLDEPIFDTCGTGGSGTNKFNISTAVAFILSAAGIKVAKHGNRAMSSSCGSADVLEELGIKIDVEPSLMSRAVKEVGIGFLYAPLYHGALAKVAQVRREIGIRTIFNILGPLCNPGLASHQLLGVYEHGLVEVMCRVLKKMGVKKAFVVCSKDLKDEVSLSSLTQVAYLNNNKINKFTLKPSDFGLKRAVLEDLEVKDAKMSAKVIKDIFDGGKGVCRDIVLANASCCFYILGRAKSFKEGVKLAAEVIDAGKVKDKFLQFKKFLEGNESIR